MSIGGVDHRFAPSQRRHVVAVGDGLAAHALDLVDHLLGRGGVGAGAVDVAAEVVDDDLGAVAGQARACSRPMPRPAPVTIATLPFDQSSHGVSFPSCVPVLATSGVGTLVIDDPTASPRLRIVESTPVCDSHPTQRPPDGR